MLDLISHQGNANRNPDEVALDTHEDGENRKVRE